MEPNRQPRQSCRPPRPRALPALVLTVVCLCQAHSLEGVPESKITPDFREAIGYAVAGNYQAALKLFRAELLKAPEDPLANYYVGMTEYKLEKFEASTVYFEKAVRNKAPFPQAYFWLAKAYFELGMESEASEVTKLGLERFPKNADLLRLSGSSGIK